MTWVFLDLFNLLANCSLVVNDSGGLQKEAFFFRKFCCTIREQSEWIELVENGYNFLVGTNQALIIKMTTQLLSADFPAVKNYYGNGSAFCTICQNIIEFKS
jgi:UDP-GlcNAc3NAcA epimerase